MLSWRWSLIFVLLWCSCLADVDLEDDEPGPVASVEIVTEGGWILKRLPDVHTFVIEGALRSLYQGVTVTLELGVDTVAYFLDAEGTEVSKETFGNRKYAQIEKMFEKHGFPLKFKRGFFLQRRGNEYEVFNQKISMDMALLMSSKLDHQGRQGSLIAPTDMQEMSLLEEHLGRLQCDSFWLNVYRPDTTGSFIWRGGDLMDQPVEEPNFTFWQKGEPQDGNQCAVCSLKRRGWKSHDCKARSSVVIKYPLKRQEKEEL